MTLCIFFLFLPAPPPFSLTVLEEFIKDIVREIQAATAQASLSDFDSFDWDAHANSVQTFFESLAPVDLGNSFVSLPEHSSLGSKVRFRESTLEGRVVLMRRQLATKIVTEVKDLGTKDDNRLFVYGAQGVGKSHALYDAVCSLMSEEKWRVVYVNDCKRWDGAFSVDDRLDSFHYLLRMIATGFHPKQDDSIWNLCRNAKNPADVSRIVFSEIPKYCKENNLQFAFVFDQHNGITPEHRANVQYPYCWLENRMQVEHSWKKCGVLVLSASANNEYVLEPDHKNQTFRRLDNRELCFTGFSDDEFRNWKIHHKFFHEESDDNKRDWESVNAILSKWPLLLDDLRQRAKDTTKALQLLAELEKYRTERLAFWSQVEESHYNRVTASDKQKQSRDNEIVFAMYVNRGGDQSVRELYIRGKGLLNKHIMFWDADKAQFFCTNNLARQVFVGRYLSQTNFQLKE